MNELYHFSLFTVNMQLFRHNTRKLLQLLGHAMRCFLQLYDLRKCRGLSPLSLEKVATEQGFTGQKVASKPHNVARSANRQESDDGTVLCSARNSPRAPKSADPNRTRNRRTDGSTITKPPRQTPPLYPRHRGLSLGYPERSKTAAPVPGHSEPLIFQELGGVCPR